MTVESEPSTLDELRREIDRIDDALHDAMLRRAALMERVAKTKPGQRSPMRPGREAMVLRRLAERHEGPLQPAVVARIWRELMNASTALQGPMAVAVCAPEKSVGYWDMARNHFGSATHMTLHVSPMVVLRNVVEQAGMVGVLPLPQEGEANPWWLALLSERRGVDVPRIIWRLPFFASPTGRFDNLGALAVARIAPEPTGRDVSVLAVETLPDVSRARLTDAMRHSGFPGRTVATYEGAAVEGRLSLLEIDDFVAEQDPRLEQLTAVMDGALERAIVLGAYPTPFGPAGGQAEPGEPAA